MNSYKIEPSKLSKFSDLPIDIVEASSPEIALNKYLKHFNVKGKPERMTGKYIQELFDSGLSNEKAIELIDFTTELIDTDYPISGNIMWHIKYWNKHKTWGYNNE